MQSSVFRIHINLNSVPSYQSKLSLIKIKVIDRKDTLGKSDKNQQKPTNNQKNFTS